MVLSAAAHAQRPPAGLFPLGTAPNSLATGVSADGSVVVGYGYDALFNGNASAFRWTDALGVVLLGRLNGGPSSHAHAVSGDGSIVVGMAPDGASGNVFKAFRWTQATGMVSLGDINGGGESRAYGISGDGRVIVGVAGDGNAGAFRAFRWTAEGGMTSLGLLPGDNTSWAWATNADGSAVAGVSIRFDLISGTGTAFRWTQAGGLVGLGKINGGTHSEARGISADGNVVVGFGADGSTPAAPGPGGQQSRAFRWTPATGMVSLGTLSGGNFSQAYGVSRDGRVVVGAANDASSTRAFRWTQGGGMQTVENWLRANGVDVPNDITAAALATNQDGSVVVGSLSNSDSFIARAASGLISPAAFNPTLVGAGTAASAAGIGLSSLVLFGSHHRPLMDNGLIRTERGLCGWLTGDAGSDSHGDYTQILGEGGICRDLDGGRWRVGVGLGAAGSRQQLDFDGSARLRGGYAIGEADYSPDGRWIVSATVLYGDFDARIQRNYLNAGVADGSIGRPDARAWAVRGRFDWLEAGSIGSFKLGPYVSLTHYETRLDGYGESGGGFPAQFGDQRQTAEELRIGVTGRSALSSRTQFRLTAEAVHEFGGSASSINGQVTNLFAFSFPGVRDEGTWGRIGAEIDYRLENKSVISAGLNVASGDAPSTVSGSVSWKFAF